MDTDSTSPGPHESHESHDAIERAVLGALRAAGGRALDPNELERLVRRAVGGPSSDVPPGADGLGPLYDEVCDAADRLAKNGRLVEVTDNSWRLSATETISEDQVAPSGKDPEGLAGLELRLHELLKRKGQVILCGPPGTGKTYWARRSLQTFAAWSWYGKAHDADLGKQLDKAHAIETCTFHPGFGYEDFIEGYRPTPLNGQVGFALVPGVFKKLCERARKDEHRNYYLLIDELNRGDVPRIFGELLTVLEYDKRGTSVTLAVSHERFHVPPNVYVIGTMNTADRSISLLDFALRRRFGFVELMPDGTAFEGAKVGDISLDEWLAALNDRIEAHVGRDARNLRIGHAYLMPRGKTVATVKEFGEVVRDEIIPLLREYYYEDVAAFGNVIGTGLVGCLQGDLSKQAAQETLAAELRKIVTDVAASTNARAPR
jgi:5-methylcytosine-specific restriction protein B